MSIDDVPSEGRQQLPRASEQNSNSRLLSLPAEIRLRIYEFALAPEGVVRLAVPEKLRPDVYTYVTWDKAGNVDADAHLARFGPPGYFGVVGVDSTINLALLRTCPQTHQEARNFAWEKNTFMIDNDATLCLKDNACFWKFMERVQRLFVVNDIGTWHHLDFLYELLDRLHGRKTAISIRIAFAATPEPPRSHWCRERMCDAQSTILSYSLPGVEFHFGSSTVEETEYVRTSLPHHVEGDACEYVPIPMDQLPSRA